jgi:hypothetical protein
MRVGTINFAIWAIIVFLTFPSIPLNAVNPAIVDPAIATPIPGADSAEGKMIVGKMASIIFPKVDFEKLDITAVVDFLNIKSRELDPEHVGIHFRLALPPASDSTPRRFRRVVWMTLTDEPLQDVLAYVCEQTNLCYRIEKGVVILAPTDTTTPIRAQ